MKKSLLTFAALFLIGGSLIAQVPGNVPTIDLEAWWGFNGNTNDLSGNGNNLTNNGAVLTTDRNSQNNSAYSFNGSSQYLVSNVPSFTFGQTDTFSVSFWMHKTSFQYGIALMQSSNTGGNFIWICQTNATGNMSYGAGKQSTGWTWAASPYTTNTWEHYVATYEGGSMKLYKNGNFVTSSTFAFAGAVKTSLPFRVGRSHNGNYFSGKVDDIGIWSRALTQTEITSLYVGCNATVSGQPSDVSVATGNNAMFGISTASTGLTYQWESNSSGSYQSISNNSTYMGVTTDTLNITGVTTALDGVKYRCVVADGTSCYDTSMAVTLTVCGAITAQPVSQSVTVNSVATFGIASNDSSATFKWQVKAGTSFVDLVNNTYYSGTKTDTLTINPTTITFDGNEYRCVMTSSVCTENSDLAKLTVGYVGLDELENNLGVVFPNPANDVLNIKMNDGSFNSEFKIINALGEVVFEDVILTEETRIDISKLAEGNYMLIIGEKSFTNFTVVD